MPIQIQPDKDTLHTLTAYWLAETVRLREDLAPLEDAAATRRARGHNSDLATKILYRASLLGQREKLDCAIEKWASAAKWTFAGLMLAALMAGVGAAASALGDGVRSVNLLLALITLLGLHGITFIVWLASWRVGTDTPGTWLGQAWLWLTRKLARGPNAALVPTAFVLVLARSQALRWVTAAVSHALWVGALTSALLTLLALLSARYYSFNWETTLLSPDTFVRLTSLIGWLPSKLGFSMPPEDIVRVSDGVNVLSPDAQALWSSWLIGATVVYGLAPRIIALGLCLIVTRRKLGRLNIDTSLPGYNRLRMRLQPSSERAGTDAPPGSDHRPGRVNRARPAHSGALPVIAGLELGHVEHWPPLAIASAPMHDAGLIDSIDERNALLDDLHDRPADTLLLVCDGDQTPDRGIIAFIHELSGYARHTHIVLIRRGKVASTPHPAWTQRLHAAGIEPHQIHNDFSSASTWFSDTHDPFADPSQP